MKKIVLIVLIVLAGVVVRYAIDKYSDNTYNTHEKDTTMSAGSS